MTEEDVECLQAMVARIETEKNECRHCVECGSDFTRELVNDLVAEVQRIAERCEP